MSNDYEVGYKKPPERCQFKKGQSGNPGGRPKGTRNLMTDLSEELAEEILIKEGSRALKISKQRAFIKSLLARTLKGDARAANTLVSMIFRLLDPAKQGADEERPLSGAEQDTLAALKQRLLQEARTQKNQNGGVAEEEEQYE